VLERKEVRRYRPFDDALVEGKFDWAGFARNLIYGVVAAAALIVASVLTGGIAVAASLGAGIAAGVTTVVISATDYSTGNVRSYEEAKHAIDVAAICGAVTGAVSCLLSGLSIFANPFADMAIKEVIEGCVDARMGILVRTFEAMGLPPEERLAYIYGWKSLTHDFGVGTLIGIGVGGAGIAFKSAAGEAAEQAAKGQRRRALEGFAERAAKETFKVPSFADYMSPEDAKKYLESLENGSTAGLRPEELLGVQRVDDYLALSRVDYDEVLRLRNGKIEGDSGTEIVPYYFSNGGAIKGIEHNMYLMPGDIIDRYGKTTGKYFSPAETSLEMRALLYGVYLSQYRQYEVLKPFEVEASTIAPAFDRIGLGTQYHSRVSAEVLAKKRIIKLVGGHW